MTVTPASLIARFPEFTEANTAYPDMVQAAIDEAGLFVDTGYWGSKADTGIQYMAAHLIATNPLGEMARLEATKDGSTTYLINFNRLKMSLGAGCRVI